MVQIWVLFTEVSPVVTCQQGRRQPRDCWVLDDRNVTVFTAAVDHRMTSAQADQLVPR